jgi:RNA recognition motif-containing protein
LATKLYVGSLPYRTSEDELREFFESVGTVVAANVAVDRFSGRSRGFGFVEMSSEEEANRAIEELNGKQLGDRTIIVQEARPQEERPPGGQRRFGGGGGGGRGDYRDPRR